MKCYYAHPQYLYGTRQELRDVDLLKDMGWQVINPGDPDIEADYQAWCAENKDSDPMAFFRNLVLQCGVVAFRACPDGRLTSGVWQEVRSAMRWGKCVIELPCDPRSRAMSHEDTIHFLKEVGQR